MQGAHGYGSYGYGGYGYDAGAYNSTAGGYGYDAGEYGSAGTGYGYNAGSYGTAGAGYYSNGYPAPAYEDPLAGGRRAHDFPAPLNGLELQPSEACPKNYVIFDQTCTKSRVMFHPSLAHKLGGSSSLGHHGTYRHGAVGAQDAGRCPVRQEEDEEEIDALLSSDDGGTDDDVVSTGRTPGGYRDDDRSSPDTACSSSRGGSGGGKPRKKERLNKMMRTLRGIVPGGNQMDTPAVLDGAVRYLKSLKVEAQKLGVRGGSDS
jgi:hypothetical protein